MRGKIIDIHQHLGDVDAGALVETYAQLGVVKAVLLGQQPSRRPGENEKVLAAAKRYPDLFIPFAGFDLDEMAAGVVRHFRDEGFRGLKFIGPRRPYDSSCYFPVYERAAYLKMPVLFHLGIVANHPPWTDANSDNMRPIHLDFIARRLPELAIIGAHLGNPWYDEAAMACRWNPNLFFDLSGSTLKKKSPEYLGGLLWWRPDSRPYGSPDHSGAWDKILFGSDLAPEWIEDSIRDYEKMMDALSLSAEDRRKVWYGNAARVLRLGE